MQVSVTGRLWQGACLSPARAKEGGSKTDLVMQLLALRGHDSFSADKFLNPRMRDLMSDPHHIDQLDIAAERLAEALTQHHSVCVLADFDVDGATSATLLFDYCQYFGVRPIVEIPDRLNEGYGPNARIMDTAVSIGAQLLVCLDCGTAAADLLDSYHNRLDIMVIDHHQPEAALPKVTALVNPRCSAQGTEHFGDLAAVGVVFMVLVATNRILRAQGHDVPI